ncbi:MarR family transcriptional regulator [Nisaea acidiphila]|uniref:MarR family transcriptional regulator n=1 Tax=Nisaea acidiphila TaxID=1862145 RepID=A0A9J7AR68_9PROT|nr:MarR family transcriptional regulator [Nisaea acidiphila]UUX48836.1 MarR family transcriptional regulator [Nisaea acidiphila]
MTENRSQHALIVLRQILRATENRARKLSRESGLTASQLLLLQTLEDEGECTAGTIAARLGITQATTTSLVQKLEAKGLITRKRGDTDRRKVWLTLSDTGRQKLADAPDSLQDLFSRRFEKLEDWEQMMLMANLERVASMLDAEEIDASPVLDIGALDREA